MHARVLLFAVAAVVGCAKAGPSRQASSAADTTPGAGQLPLTEQRLLEASSIDLPLGVIAESLPDPTSAGARILSQYCTQCHALPSPTMHGPVDWPTVARRMWVRIDMMAGALGVRIPSTAERAQLLAYLQQHALQVASDLPAGPGKELFQTVCSRCHALVDPRMHTPPDWGAVVVRMETNMVKMKTAHVSDADAMQILGYLESASRRLRSR